MATNYEDKKAAALNENNADKKAALNEVDVTYGNMINESTQMYDKLQQNLDKYEKDQIDLQTQKGDLAIEKLEQANANAQKDYLKEQSAAYTDWQKQSNQYGANAEQMAASGLAKSGYSESSLVSMYNTYQNRVAVARESIERTNAEFAIAMKDAQLQNDSILAEIAFNTMQQKLQLAVEGFQYKNQLILDKANKKLEVQQIYQSKWMDTLQELNADRSFEEEKRQADRAYELQLEDLKLAQAAQKLNEDKFAYEKKQDAIANAAKKVASGGSSLAKSATTKKVKGGKTSTTGAGVVKGSKSAAVTASAYAYLNALIKSGASKDKVSNEIAIALRDGEITKKEAQTLRNTFTPRGLAY